MSEELKVRAIQWRDKINSRIGPISGRDADAIAAFLNIVSAEIGRAEKAERERDELRAALEGVVSVYRDKDTDAAMETEIVLAEAALIATKKEG